MFVVWFPKSNKRSCQWHSFTFPHFGCSTCQMSPGLHVSIATTPAPVSVIHRRWLAHPLSPTGDHQTHKEFCWTFMRRFVLEPWLVRNRFVCFSILQPCVLLIQCRAWPLCGDAPSCGKMVVFLAVVSKSSIDYWPVAIVCRDVWYKVWTSRGQTSVLKTCVYFPKNALSL